MSAPDVLAGPPAPGIVLRGVTKTVTLGGGQHVPVLSPLELRMRLGRVSVLIGPSGCGKTTLLRIIAGLEAPTDGVVEYSGLPARRIGIVYQDFTQALMPWRTVLGNVELGMEIGGTDSRTRRARAAEFLHMVGLEKFRNAYPRELSGGMRQRVQIARVLAYDPDVLLLDEPFGSLDSQLRIVLQDQLRELLQMKERTVVLVTHSMEEALYLGEEIFVLSHRPASLLRQLKPGDLRSRPPYREFAASSEFVDLRRRLWDILSEELQG